jgi:tetratricopeptide (TPR) repeat protein
MAVTFHTGFNLRQLVAVGMLLLGSLAPAQTATFGAACPPADGTPEDRTYPIRKLAFDALTAGRHEDARHLMRCAIRANPHDLVALRQQVYLDLNAKDPKGAAEDIDALRQQNASSPQFEAQEGYIFAAEKRYDDARLAFGRAIAGGDAAVTAQSMKAIHVLDGEFPRHVLSFAADGQYLNRFSDGIVDTSVRYYERLGSSSPFQVYVGERLLRDTASNGGTLPQIFSDNALLSGVGIAYLQPREIVDLTHQGSLRLRPFLQESVALDTNQQFYNNVFELIPGFEISDIDLHGFGLRVEYVRGFYLPFANSSANPYGSSYSDFRFRLLFQKNIPLGSGAR